MALANREKPAQHSPLAYTVGDFRILEWQVIEEPPDLPPDLPLEQDAARPVRLAAFETWQSACGELAMAEPMPNSNTISKRTQEIPDKLYFRIGEVARLCGVAASVLRFWETEFPHLKPNKGGTGQRLYRRRDVEMALRIKRLLYDEGYTIPGARQVFKAEQKQPTPLLSLGLMPEPGLGIDRKKLMRLQRELEELHTMLAKPLAAAKLARAKTPVPRGPELQPAPVHVDATDSQTAKKSGSTKPLTDEDVHRLFDDTSL